MRQVYASSRLENVERVAELLQQADIEVYVSEGRSYKGNRRRQFSFREGQQPESGVWIVKADDLSRANQIMREIGLGRSTRDHSFVPSAGRVYSAADAGRKRSPAARVRTVLLIILTILAGITSWKMLRGGEATQPASQPEAIIVETCTDNCD
ncbi:pathogenicity-like protein [Pseudomarimonas arenosa]|uniref:Pathogenicity-like protein n=1 Tax=Pseudomarimonas arenosa TaxID=2774145 RepID=A0AAW3ZRJ9_9GAMM|nr:pathogenicity-like protein [Pseudomarimonas arenosa]MBD8527500.1 pathogenicity-like protein [Pseudomarimonas arenosa]